MDMMPNVAPNSAELSGRERRRNDRYAGPFDGYRVDIIEMPLSIFDLSRGGCFVNSSHEQEPGVTFTMKIDLPRVGWVTLRAETLYARTGYGFAVRFIDVGEATAARLEQGLEDLFDRVL
jgi:PilZ domain